MTGVQLKEATIQQLFGHEAAEDEDPDRLKRYYFKSATYEQVNNDLAVRILVGHKGIGKSALFKVAVSEHGDRDELAVVVKPDDILDFEPSGSDFLALVRGWKVGLRKLILRRAGALLKLGPATSIPPTADASIIDTLHQLTEASSGPATLIRQRFLQAPAVYVFIDDLDRGWKGLTQDVLRISALFSAIRDLAVEERGLKFRLSLRSDVFFLVRTSDESTDKIEGSVIWHSWTNHEIFGLLAKRIETFFSRDLDLSNLATRSQADLAKYLDPVFEGTFRGQGYWANVPMHRVLMSMTRQRPRDLVKLCTLAARDASRLNRRLILTDNIQNVLQEYSQGRIQDLVNEFRSELPEIERLVLNMRPTVKEKTTKQGYVYDTAELIKKLTNISQQGEFKFFSNSLATPKDLAVFLYKINFLTARRQMPGGKIVRSYFEEQRYLQSSLVDFGYSWEVHPAYRWALQPGESANIYNTLELAED